MPLGKRVSQIRSEGKYIENNDRRRQQLDKLGFVWRLRSETQSAIDSVDISFVQIYEALKVYRSEVQPTGPLTVPAEFTVPESTRWPESLRGLPLGRSVQKLRSTSYLNEHPGAEEKLNAIGFQVSAKAAANDARFDNVYAALQRYLEIYGDLLVPQPFEVPSDSQDWPKATWGLRLGARVNAIRSQGTFVKSDPERRQLLDEIGFIWTPPEGEGRKRGRKSKSEIEAEDAKRAIEIDSTEDETQLGGQQQVDDDDLDSFVASFDFSGTDSSAPHQEEDHVSPTWGFEAGADFEEVVAAAKEDAAKQAAMYEYKPPQSLQESLAAAKQRAIEVGIVLEG
jgi:Helicase associated domain